MQTSLLSNTAPEQQHTHEHSGDDSCGCGHEHAPVRWWQTLVGVVFVANAFIVDWFFERGMTVSSVSAMIGAIVLGYPIVQTAIRDLKTGVLSINELVAIAVLAAFATGDYKTAGVVAFFMLMGEIIETRTAEGARASIESLIKLTPTKARRITKTGEEEVAAKDLAVGDVIRIRPGDNVAADGVIVTGQGSFNQATITGESLPADKKPGDEVFAGTQNLTGVLEIRVSRAGQDTTLDANNLLGGPFSIPGPVINGQAVVPPGQLGIVNTIPPRPSRVLHDAIFEAANDLATRERSRRRIVLVISDGLTSGNDHTFDQTRQALLEKNVEVYAVGLDQPFPYKKVSVLDDYAKSTGGDVYFADSLQHIERSYAAATEEARNQYVLGYISTNEVIGTGPVFRDIVVEIFGRNLKTVHRKGYYQYP